MAISLKRVSTRSSVDTPFYTRSAEVEAHIQTTYGDTGQRLSVTVTVSADGLVETREAIWASYPELINTELDNVVLNNLASMKSYNLANGITVEETVVVI